MDGHRLKESREVLMENVIESVGNFARDGYAVLRQLVPEQVHAFLYEYILKSARAGRLRIGDSGVPGTPNFYADEFMESLLELMLPRVEAASGFRLYPTYSYFRLYKHGDVLKRHQDRPSCEISVTLSLGYRAAHSWPIWIEADGVPKSLALEAGDGMLYRGCDIPHWRDRFPGKHAAQAFLHYVDQDGSNREFRYDQRESLGTSPNAMRIMGHLMSVASSPQNQ